MVSSSSTLKSARSGVIQKVVVRSSLVCCRGNSTALLMLLFQSLWLQAPDNHAAVCTAKATAATRESSLEHISEAKAKSLGLFPYGRFLHMKQKHTPNTLQHSQVLVTLVHQTQRSDTDCAHSITASFMPGLAGLSSLLQSRFYKQPTEHRVIAYSTNVSLKPQTQYFPPKSRLLLKN